MCVARIMLVSVEQKQTDSALQKSRYVQYCEFAWLQRQHWEQGETYDEADKGCRVASTEDKQAVPSAHYSTRRLSAWPCSYVSIALNADESGKCSEGMQLKDFACDDNGRAGASVDRPALVDSKMMYMKHIYSRANHPSSSSLRVGAGNGAPGPSCVGSRT